MIDRLGVGAHFQVLHDRIVTPGDGLIIFQGMQASTAESIKSLEGFDIAWVEEAQTLSARSLSLLRPTIRKEGSELWANWNPRRKKDAIDEFLRQKREEARQCSGCESELARQSVVSCRPRRGAQARSAALSRALPARLGG